jgi:hypothetical protein
MSGKREQKLSMSFTTGTLLYHESMTVANLFCELGEWAQVRSRVVEQNLLQMRTLNASKRIYREVAGRLQLLTQDQLALLCEGAHPEQVALLWLAVCKRYEFIRRFAVQVLREKYLHLDLRLAHEDYDIFFNQMAEWHPEVEAVAPATRVKQRQVVFKMMREADLLSPEGEILPAMLSSRFIEVVVADAAEYLDIFPITPLRV